MNTRERLQEMRNNICPGCGQITCECEEIKMKLPNKRYKSILGMVWGTSGSLSFKLYMTKILVLQKLKGLFKKEDN